MTADVPARMSAAVFHGGTDIRVVELPTPTPGPGEVLVRVRAAGICGSDVLAYRGRGPWQHTAENPGQDGHELAGDIAAVGDGVTDRAVGQRVAVEPKHLIACGECPYCRAGRSHLCARRGLVGGVHVTSKGFAGYDTCPADRAHPLPDNVSYAAGAILDCYACGVHTLNLVDDLGPGATMVVLGSGTMGLTCGQVARARGVRVLLTGTDRAFLDLARSCGAADDTVLVGGEAAAVDAFTDGRGADVVVDAVSIPGVTLAQAIDAVTPGGRIVVLGVFDAPPTFEPHRAYVKEITLLWSNSYGTGEYDAALRLLASGAIDADPLITHEFPLAEIGKAFVAASAKDTSLAMKVVVTP